jgi:hypothetical protein
MYIRVVSSKYGHLTQAYLISCYDFVRFDRQHNEVHTSEVIGGCLQFLCIIFDVDGVADIFGYAASMLISKDRNRLSGRKS